MPAYSRILLPWDRQPQHAAEIAQKWRGRVINSAYLGTMSGYIDLLTGAPLSTTYNCSFGASQIGVSPLFTTTGDDVATPSGSITAGLNVTRIAAFLTTSLAATNVISNSATSDGLRWDIGTSGSISIADSGAAFALTSGNVVSVNTPYFGAIRREGTSNYAIALNGQIIATGTYGSAISDSSGPLIGNRSTSSTNAFKGYISCHIEFGEALSDGEIAALTNDLWGEFFAPRTIWVPVSAGGGTSYTITPSGGITFAGSGLDLRTKVIAPSGGVTFAGTGSMVFASGGTTYTITPSGGVTMGGDGGFLKSKFFTPTGGVTMGGTSEMIKTKIVSPSGGVLFGGTGSMSSNTSTAVQTNERTKVGVGT